ncbi:MAG: hypothetical protein ABEH81_01035 [Halopenitus sp.]
MGTDIQKTLERLGDHQHVSVALPGTLAVSDYLGDTANDNGVPVEQSTLENATVNLQTSPNASSTIQIENETSGTTHSFDVSSTYHEETGIDLHFSEGDELSVTVTSVGATAAGGDGQVDLEFSRDEWPAN